MATLILAKLYQLKHIALFAALPPIGLLHSAAAFAETSQGGAVAGPVLHGTAPPSISPANSSSDEIVVLAKRRGEAEVAAETEFDEDEIAGQGVDSIQDLLTRIAPYISDDGGEPALLINGKPVGFDRSILSYPTEALERLTLLKPEAAAHYGETAGRRVVNLVLKRSFSMLNTDASVDFPTAGGQLGKKLSVTRTAIRGNTRWNASARIGHEGALLKSERNIPRREGVFDGIGFISAVDEGEIDPVLSQLVGRVVRYAAIPQGTLLNPPELMDFAVIADRFHPLDPNRFETLQSSQRTAAFSIGITRPIGDFSASINMSANKSNSDGLRGLPMVSVYVAAENPWSPFADDILLTRPFAGERPLRTHHNSSALGASLTVNGHIGDWQTNFGVNYSHNWSNSYLENGIDQVRAQQLLDTAEPSFNPFGQWGEDLLLTDRNRSANRSFSFRFNVRKSFINLPAGPLVWSFSAHTSYNSTQGQQGDALGDLMMTRNAVRRLSSGQMSLSIPVTRRGGFGATWLGDLTFDVSASAQLMTNSRVQKRYGSSVNWSPWSAVQLRGGLDYMQVAPSFDHLAAPIVTTVNRIFDYTREVAAAPLWTTGGNPNLQRGNRQSLSLAATVRPLGDQLLTLNLGYRRSVAKGGITIFPELTPVIEAAFPERVTRDGDGQLLAVDARAINIAHNKDDELTSALALRLPQRRRETPRNGAPNARPIRDDLQFSLSLNHRWKVKSQLLTRVGVPVIDQLRDSGQSRHNLSLQMALAKRGIGANLSGNWSNSARLKRGAANVDDFFIYTPPLTVNTSIFVEPDRLFEIKKKRGLINGLKISVDVQNLFNAYRRVTLGDGSRPPGYSRDEADPLGRAIRITLRKKF